MNVNYYYSVRVMEEEGGYEEGEEEGLLSLCRPCAHKHADAVQWASRGDEQSECEFCPATNDPEHSAYLDKLFFEVKQKYAA